MSAALTALLTLAADYDAQIAYVSPETQAIFSWLSGYGDQRYRWLEPGEILDDISNDDWLQIQQLLTTAWAEVSNSMLGTILWTAAADIPYNMLLCDGTTYPRADYPALYDALDPIFQVDADHFMVPDLRGRFAMSPDDTHTIGTTGGSFNAALEVANLPAHSHDATVTDTGHVHTEIAAVPTIINGGLEAPAIAAEAVPDLTGLAFTGIGVSIGDTGSGDSFDVTPPYQVLKAVMVAL